MNPVTDPTLDEAIDWPVLKKDTPIIYEDVEAEATDMGEASQHYGTTSILYHGVSAHLRKHWPRLRAYANMNCYYAPSPIDPKSGSLPYFSSDVMIVNPKIELPKTLTSYTIGKHGPTPLGSLEVLSKSNAEDNDMDVKLRLYADLKIGEYILIDPSGDFIEERLLLKQRRRDGSWKDIQDKDGGVTSKLGFRLIIDVDDELTVLDAATGKRYPRPDQAEAEAEARRAAEQAARIEAKRARAEAKRADAEAQRAEAEAKRAQAEAQRAEGARRLVEAETAARRLAEEQVELLRAELERLRRGQG